MSLETIATDAEEVLTGQGIRTVLHALIDRVTHVSQEFARELHSLVEADLGPAPKPEDPAVAAARIAAQRADLEAQLAALGPVTTVPSPLSAPVTATPAPDASASVPADSTSVPTI